MLQVALDGRWEEATELPLPLIPETAERLLTELLAESDDVALELLWPGPPIVFVGARLAPGDRFPVHLLVNAEPWIPTRVLGVLGGTRPVVPVAAVLGAVNAWKSLRPLDLPVPTNGAGVARALRSRPDIAECPRPVALEVVYRAAREAWWGIEVSDRVDDRHVVTPPRVTGVLARHEPRCLSEPL